jgi:hypothetical protein
LSGIVLDLAEIERGRTAVARGVATQGAAVKYAFEFVLGGDRAVAKGRCDTGESLAVEAIHRQIDAEAQLGIVDEWLAKGNADVDDADAPAVAHDRRHGEDAERIPPGFDADNRLAGLVRLHHGLASRGDVIAEDLGLVHTEEIRGRRRLEADQRHAPRLYRRQRRLQQRHERVALALGDGLRHRGQIGDDGADRQCGAAFIVEGGHDAVILQLELLVEREPCQRAQLNNRKSSQDPADHRDRQ